MVSVRVDPVLVTRLDAMSRRPSLPHTAATVLAIVLSTGLLAACSGGAPEPSPSTSAATVSPTVTPTPTPAEEAPPTSPTTPAFDKAARSVDDPASLWVVSDKLRPLDPVDYVPADLVTPDVTHQNPPTLRAEAAALLALHEGVVLQRRGDERDRVAEVAERAEDGAGGRLVELARRRLQHEVRERFGGRGLGVADDGRDRELPGPLGDDQGDRGPLLHTGRGVGVRARDLARGHHRGEVRLGIGGYHEAGRREGGRRRVARRTSSGSKSAATSSQNGLGSRGLPSSVAASRTSVRRRVARVQAV